MSKKRAGDKTQRIKSTEKVVIKKETRCAKREIKNKSKKSVYYYWDTRILNCKTNQNILERERV